MPLRPWLRSLTRRRSAPIAPPVSTKVGRAGFGEPPAAAPEAAEAELDTLRGELVRELDRLAADDGGAAAFRRIGP